MLRVDCWFFLMLIINLGSPGAYAGDLDLDGDCDCGTRAGVCECCATLKYEDVITLEQTACVSVNWTACSEVRDDDTTIAN